MIILYVFLKFSIILFSLLLQTKILTFIIYFKLFF